MKQPGKVATTGIASAALGVAGVILVMASDGRGSGSWLLWAALTVALMAATGALAAYGVQGWAELQAIHGVRLSAVVLPLAVVVPIALFFMNVTAFLPGAAGGVRSNSALLSIATLGGVPVAAVMLGVFQATARAPEIRPRGKRLDFLVDLRLLLQRVLAATGGFNALLTLEAGAFLNLQRDLDTQFGQRPPQWVLVVGAFGSLLIAIFYLPARVRIREEATRLIDDLCPVGDVDDAPSILAKAETRQSLAALLRSDRPLLADLQSDLFVLAPLLTAIPVLLVGG